MQEVDQKRFAKMPPAHHWFIRFLETHTMGMISLLLLIPVIVYILLVFESFIAANLIILIYFACFIIVLFLMKRYFSKKYGSLENVAICKKKSAILWLDVYFSIDTKGKVIKKYDYTKSGLRFIHMEKFYEGLSCFCVKNINGENFYGFLDIMGSVKIKPKFRGACSFSQGLAAFCVSNQTTWSSQFGNVQYKWGFINHEGNIAINPVLDGVKFFTENLAAVSSNNKWGLLIGPGLTEYRLNMMTHILFLKVLRLLKQKTAGTILI